MRGLFKRKASDIWQGRFRIPEELWRERARLADLSVKQIGKSQEFARSTGQSDKSLATKTYRTMLADWETTLERWRALLEHGPTVLSPKQEWALAGEHVKVFLKEHEEDPFSAPPASMIPEPPKDNGRLHEVISHMASHEREAFKRDFIRYLRASEAKRPNLAVRLISNYPGLHAALAPELAAMLDEMHGDASRKAAAKRGLTLAPQSIRTLNLRIAELMEEAYRAIEAMQDGDYSPVARLEALPTFEAPFFSPSRIAPDALTLHQLLDHKAKTQNIKDKTVRDTRAHINKFISFIGHNDAHRVTKDDVRRWRDSLIEKGKLSPKTITDRYISAVRAVLSHGVKEFDLNVNVASGIRDNRASSAPIESKGYSEEQAITILKATSGGSIKALSEPHRRAISWVPWIAAYTGLRVSEITQLLGKRFVEEDGIPYLLVTPEDGSTKSGKAWIVGIHQHLLEMGLKELMQSFDDKPVFYEPYPKGTVLSAVKGKHRALESGMRVANWIKNEVGIKAPLGRPNHAWRHLHTTRSRLCGMDKEARDFMMGSRSSTDAREGYGDWLPEVLDREVNKLPEFITREMVKTIDT